MTTSTASTTTVDAAMAARLSERLAQMFGTGEVGDLLTDDVFLDGHPPLWRFQLQGRDTFAEWLRGYVAGGAEVEVVDVVPTAEGFVAQLASTHDEDGETITDRKIVLCRIRGDRIAELSVYCSGDWDEDLRRRHTAEASLIRP